MELGRSCGGTVAACRPTPVHHGSPSPASEAAAAEPEAGLRGRVHGADLGDGVDVLHAALVAHVEGVVAVPVVTVVTTVMVDIAVVGVGVASGGGEKVVLGQEVVVRPNGFVNLQSRHIQQLTTNLELDNNMLCFIAGTATNQGEREGRFAPSAGYLDT